MRLLFNIFMSDLPKKKLELNQQKLKLDSTEIGSLIWADDIILLAESENGLAEMLSTVETYCEENKLIINTDKTKCMIFNKTGRLLRNKFHPSGVGLENVRYTWGFYSRRQVKSKVGYMIYVLEH